MSLDEQAKTVLELLPKIQKALSKISYLCRIVSDKHIVNGEVIEYSAEQKQKLIDAYQQKKTELVQLFSELP